MYFILFYTIKIKGLIFYNTFFFSMEAIKEFFGEQSVIIGSETKLLLC